MVQSTADVLLSVVPDHPRDYTYVPNMRKRCARRPARRIQLMTPWQS